jgi:hypothetical protein
VLFCRVWSWAGDEVVGGYLKTPMSMVFLGVLLVGGCVFCCVCGVGSGRRRGNKT